MRTTLLILAWLVPTVLWLLAMTLGRRGIVERHLPGSPMWFWLRTFRIPESHANRARLVVATAMVSVIIGLVLFMGSK